MAINEVKSNTPSIHAKKILQSRLHSLLSCLSESVKIIKKWPSSEGDNGQIHYDTTTTLMQSLHKLIHSLKRVEETLFSTSEDSIEGTDLRKYLQTCQIPLDLLDLMDCGGLSETGFGLNPECFIQGLLHEALRQLAGLRRRKNALTMLGAAISKGIKQREEREQPSKKRARDDTDDDENPMKKRA